MHLSTRLVYEKMIEHHNPRKDVLHELAQKTGFDWLSDVTEASSLESTQDDLTNLEQLLKRIARDPEYDTKWFSGIHQEIKNRLKSELS